jgi:type IV pilus assembly protein PilA
VSENAANGSASLATGYTAPANLKSVSAIAIQANGEIFIDYQTNVAAAGANRLVLAPRIGGVAGGALVAGTPPTDAVVWNCLAAGATGRSGTVGTLAARLAPAECR